MTHDPEGLYAELLYRLGDLSDANRPVACRTNPDAFTSDDPGERAEAAEACTYCPLLELCGAYAEAANESWHIWGGIDRSPQRKKAKGRRMSHHARVMCADLGCGSYLLTDPRHFDNLTAAGWTCSDHHERDRR